RTVNEVRHSLYVKSKNGKQLRHERVRRLVNKMQAACPWVAESDLPAARAWAEMEILAGQVYWALKMAGPINYQRGAVDGDLRARRLLEDFRLLRQSQLVYARELGLTPAARLTIAGRGAAPLDLAAAMATAHEVTDAEVVSTSTQLAN